MNIVQTIDQFSTKDILLCEPIKNTIMDNSNFIRIIVSNRIIINGIYLLLDFKRNIIMTKLIKIMKIVQITIQEVMIRVFVTTM